MLIQIFAAQLEGAAACARKTYDTIRDMQRSHPDEPITICVMREYEDVLRVQCPEATIEGIGPITDSMIGDMYRAASAATFAYKEDMVVVITDNNPTSRVLHSRFLSAINELRQGSTKW